VAFDPMQSPAIATIAALRKEEVLCEAVNVDPFAVGDTNPEVSAARALRAMMRREYRVLLPDKKPERSASRSPRRRFAQPSAPSSGGRISTVFLTQPNLSIP